jgi:hypothetical protein
MKLKIKSGGMLETENGEIKITKGGIYLSGSDYLRPEAVSHKRIVTKRPTRSSGSKKKKP